MPLASSMDLVMAGLRDITTALANPSANCPLAPGTDSEVAALKNVIELLTNKAQPQSNTPIVQAPDATTSDDTTICTNNRSPSNPIISPVPQESPPVLRVSFQDTTPTAAKLRVRTNVAPPPGFEHLATYDNLSGVRGRKQRRKLKKKENRKEKKIVQPSPPVLKPLRCRTKLTTEQRDADKLQKDKQHQQQQQSRDARAAQRTKTKATITKKPTVALTRRVAKRLRHYAKMLKTLVEIEKLISDPQDFIDHHQTGHSDPASPPPPPFVPTDDQLRTNAHLPAQALFTSHKEVDQTTGAALEHGHTQLTDADKVWMDIVYKAVHPDTGLDAEYDKLLASSQGKKWEGYCADEVGRLAQGNKDNDIEGTDTIHFIHKSDIPEGRIATYLKLVATDTPHKSVPGRV